MPAITAILRCSIKRAVRRAYSFLRLCSSSGAKGGSIHPTVSIGGRGRPVFGDSIVIGRNSTLNCAPGGVLHINSHCRIGDAVTLTVSAKGRFIMAPGAQVEAHSGLGVSSEWRMCEGSHIASYCEIGPRESVASPGRLTIGQGSGIGPHALIDLTGDLLLGRNVSIGPYSIIYTHNHRYQDGVESAWKTPVVVGAIEIDDGAWIGARVTILPGVRIGKMAIVAAGAVVVKSIPDHCIYGGVPAKELRAPSLPSKV